MIARLFVIAASVIVLAPAAGAATAKEKECAADRRFVNAWTSSLSRNNRIVDEQMQLLAKMFSLLTSNQQIPREDFDRLRALVREHDAALRNTERRLVPLKAGSANGRLFKRLALRYVREVARPLNKCLGDLLVADTDAKMAAVLSCVERTQRLQVQLSRALDQTLKKMSLAKRGCPSRP